MANSKIGSRIKILIEKENITTQSFANEIGITVGGLNHILTGRNSPRYDILLKIINKYNNINLDWLILGELPIYKKEKETLSQTMGSLSVDTDDLFMIKNIYKTEDTKEKKTLNNLKTPQFEQSSIRSLVNNKSISESIEEIRVYFNNKTYLKLKPEK